MTHYFTEALRGEGSVIHTPHGTRPILTFANWEQLLDFADRLPVLEAQVLIDQACAEFIHNVGKDCGDPLHSPETCENPNPLTIPHEIVDRGDPAFEYDLIMVQSNRVLRAAIKTMENL